MNAHAYIAGGTVLVLAAVSCCLPGLFAVLGTAKERRAERHFRQHMVAHAKHERTMGRRP